ATSHEYTTGQIKYKTPAKTTIAAADIIGASLFPLKNASASGSLTLLNRLYIIAEIIPVIIPINTLSFCPKAALTSSTSIPWSSETVSIDVRFVATKKPTSPLKATAPCLSLDNPIAIPTANSRPKLSSIDVPAISKNVPTILPSEKPKIQFPIPAKIAAAGKTATGNIKDRPRLCNLFIILLSPYHFLNTTLNT